MTFRGWPVEAIEFFERLEDDNTKSFWTDNKDTYETVVKAPMESLLSELEPDFGVGKIFRPYRDVRFSKDKTPYKTNIAATMERGGYVSLSADGLSCGTGYYMMAKDQLVKFRDAIVHETTGPALESLIAVLAKKNVEVTAHDALKTAPRGYDKDHPRIELLRMKGAIAWVQWDVGAWLGTKKVKTKITSFLADARPLVEWLDTNVGPSELEGGWGR